MVLKENNPPESIPITRPELKRTMGSIRTVECTKKWRPTSLKRASRDEGRANYKVPFGFVEEEEEEA